MTLDICRGAINPAHAQCPNRTLLHPYRGSLADTSDKSLEDASRAEQSSKSSVDLQFRDQIPSRDHVIDFVILFTRAHDCKSLALHWSRSLHLAMTLHPYLAR